MKNPVLLTALPLISFPLHVFTWAWDVRLTRNYLDDNCFSPSFAWTVRLPGIIFTLWKQKWKVRVSILLSTCKGIFAVKGMCTSLEPHTAERGKLCTHNLVQNPRPTRKHTGSCSEWLWMGTSVPYFASLLIIPQTCVKFSALFLLHFSASSLLPLQQYLPQLTSWTPFRAAAVRSAFWQHRVSGRSQSSMGAEPT